MVRLCFGRQEQLDDQPDYLCFGNARRFSYGLLQLATNNFSQDTCIGMGGFGKVYRGVLPNGTLIAVKNYYRGYFRHQSSLQEFSRMVKIMSCTRHSNINQVIGYCIHKGHGPLLVSEYVDNGTLYDLLHNHQEKRCGESVLFSWPMRVAVCIGIARGLTYLHEDVNPRAVHGDIKPSNILLDTNFTPQLTDFDFVEFSPDSEDGLPLEATVATTSGHFDSDSGLTWSVPVGTLGYIDPKCLRYGCITQKSDVYAFGVTMLQIISGRGAPDIDCDEGNQLIVNWFSNLLRDGRVLEIIDPVLTDFPTDVVQHFIDVALVCIKEESRQRPSSREVMQMLDGGCNSLRRKFLASHNTPYISAASSFKSSIATDDEGERETESADSDTESQARPEIEGAETSAAQSNANTVSQVLVQQQQLGIVLSGTGDLVERLSQTMVFIKSPKLDFPEAVYPPFRTRVFQRGGSRNLYTC